MSLRGPVLFPTKQSPDSEEIASHTILRSVQGSALAMTWNGKEIAMPKRGYNGKPLE